MKVSFAAVSTLLIALVVGEDSPITNAPEATTTYTDDWATYPSVPQTASINGFADRIVDIVPACAAPCLYADTSQTPCPYWDTGCLCVIPNFVSPVALCIAERCSGSDVESFRNIATSQCSAVGVWTPYWIVPATAESALSVAATRA